MNYEDQESKVEVALIHPGRRGSTYELATENWGPAHERELEESRKRARAFRARLGT
jgi:hypothetical protein